MQKTNLLKFTDKCLGVLVVRCMARPRPAKQQDNLRSILFIRPGGIGDAVLLIPGIRAIKKIYPGIEITVLAEKRNGAIFSLCREIDRVLLYDRSGDFLTAVRSRYDAVIDTEQWHRLSAVVARLIRAPMLVGYATNERKRLFTHSIQYSNDDYEMESFFNILAPLGIEKPVQPPVPFLTIPEDTGRAAVDLLGELHEKVFMVIFPGASISERRWGSDRFGAVTRKLDFQGIPVVVVGGKEDQRAGDEIVSVTGGLNLAGNTSLVETAAVIDKGAILLSGDSGILHIGVGLGKPTVSLFGPGIEKKWAPRGESHIVINKHLPCSPCTKFGYTPKCPINAKCMSDITVDDVFDAVLRLLEKTGNLPQRDK